MGYHLKAVKQVEEELGANRQGLSKAEAKRRLKHYGRNTLEVKKKKTVWSMLFHQLTDFMILILIAAAVVSGVVGDLTDTIVILAIVVVNAVIGLVQEWRAEKAMEALQKMAASHARVLRDNQSLEISAEELVPGDVVILEAGNIIPADLRFIETYTLKVDESSLTGESLNIEKNTQELPPAEYTIGDRLNIGYRGTFVTNGRAIGYVIATGMKTEFGRIAKMIQTDELKTPLQKRLNAFGRALTVAILILCSIFFIVGSQRGESWSTMLLTSISLAVAAIPEALPALVTIALALGAKRLVKSNALILLPCLTALMLVAKLSSSRII